MYQFTLDKKSAFYHNCIKRRKESAKICGDCPFRAWIEEQEHEEEMFPGTDGALEKKSQMEIFKIKLRGQTLRVRPMGDDEIINEKTLCRILVGGGDTWMRSKCVGERVGEHSDHWKYVEVQSKFFK